MNMPVIVPRPSESQYPLKGTLTPRSSTARIMLHCTANSGDVDFAHLYKCHVVDNGWYDVGYHFLIRQAGTIQACRDLTAIGAGCSGQNHDTIHIAYAGGIRSDGSSVDNRTDAQIASQIWLIRKLMAEYPGIDDTKDIVGHNQFAAKDCPCFNVPEWVDSVFDSVGEVGDPEGDMPAIDNLVQYIRELEARIAELERWRAS